MNRGPSNYRCAQCGAPLDELLDNYTVPPDFCPGTDCEAKYEAKRHRGRDAWRTFTAFLATMPHRLSAGRTPYLNEVTTSMRPNTPVRREGSRTIAVVKRSCNGCGVELGDATAEEIRLVNTGRKADLPDVRGECARCSALTQAAGVALGEEVLYRLQSTGEWMRGQVGAISATNGQLRIALMDGTEAVEVGHGFGPHEWCTLDELIEHRKVAAS